MSAATPAASIIIPTHSRALTLPFSIQSALNQSIEDIEILVVGDGCTEGCRAVAIDFAARDKRVRFLDQAKAPGLGGANRDLAVRQSRSQHIFYNDDDDLLLPHHVAVLARLLGEADIADTPVVSVAPNRRVDLGLHDSSHARQRELLASGKLKMVFDTHLAHRRDAYLALGGPWLKASGRFAVPHLLGAFAGDARIKWLTAQRITALSFHGMRRVTMADLDRENELRSWADAMANPGLEKRIRAQGSYSFHAFTLARAFAKAGASGDEIGAYLSRLLLEASDVGASERQRASIDVIVALATRQEPPRAGVREVFVDLLDARLGPGSPTRSVIRHFRAHFSRDELFDLLIDQPNDHAILLARLRLRMPEGAGVSKLLSDALNAFEEAPSVTKFHFAVDFADCLVEAESLTYAWEWTERALPLAPHSFHASKLWQLRVRLASALGRRVQGEHAAAQLSLLETLVS